MNGMLCNDGVLNIGRISNKPKIMYPNMTKYYASFYYDENGFYQNG